MNCWEFFRCGREPGGANADHGVCPAATCTSANGIHYGKNAGRACWAIQGTPCTGLEDPTWPAKMGHCRSCTFHLQVQQAEADNLLSHDDIHLLVYGTDAGRPMLRTSDG